MRFLFLSTHAFLPVTRKTSVHFVTEALAARGHEVDTISVGFSYLTALKRPALYAGLSAEQRNRFVTRPRRAGALPHTCRRCIRSVREVPPSTASTRCCFRSTATCRPPS
jgi:hypothetical protein